MRKRVSAVIKTGLVLLASLTLAFLLLKNPSVASRGIKNGLLTVGGVLIPSLFPFMTLACFIENSGVSEIIGRVLSPVVRIVFHLPEDTAATILMSFIGGFPVGAKMTDSLYREGKITSVEASRMYLFCINAGPAFTVSAVGSFIRTLPR